MLGIDADLHQPDPQPIEATAAKRNRCRLAARRQRDSHRIVARLGCEIDDLPLGRQLSRQSRERCRLHDHGEDPLVEVLGKEKLSEAPFRCHPRRRDEEDHHLATVGGSLQGLLPALPGLQSALGIEVEKHIVPTLGDHPVTDGDGLSVVGARMGEKDT